MQKNGSEPLRGVYEVYVPLCGGLWASPCLCAAVAAVYRVYMSLGGL
jgi:hypothetical protein